MSGMSEVEPYMPRKRSSPRREDIELWSRTVQGLNREDYANMADSYNTGSCNWMHIGVTGAAVNAITCDNAGLEYMPCIGTCGR